MFNFLKFILCLQCFVLLKGVDLSNDEMRAFCANERWKKKGINYLDRASNRFTMEDNLFVDTYEPHCNLCDSSTNGILEYNKSDQIIIRDALFYFDDIQVSNLSNQDSINDVRGELLDLNLNMIKQYRNDLIALLFYGDVDDSRPDNAKLHADNNKLKVMIWNRILFVRETFHEILRIKDPSLSSESLKSLPVFDTYTQLSKITKNHIENLWGTLNISGMQYMQYEEWRLIKPQTPALKFAALIANIFKPLIV